VILVEGPAEKYGLGRLASLHGFDIGDVTIVSCNGKDKIQYYTLLCQVYGIEPFVIFDCDAVDVAAPANANIVNRIGNAKYFAFSKSFEHEIGVSRNHPHKASEVLKRIDSMGVGDLTAELDTLLRSLKAWLISMQADSTQPMLYSQILIEKR